MSALDILIRLVLQGQGETQSGLNATGDAANDLGDALDEVGNSEGLNNVGEGAENATDGLEGAVSETEKLHGKLESLRNAGAVLAGIGAGGLMLSQEFIEAHKEGAGLEKRLESLLKTQGRLADLDGINDQVANVRAEGHFDGDDSIREAAIHLASFSVETEHLESLLPRVARQVRTGFGDMTSVADGLGKAYSGLDLGPLTRSGLVFTESEKTALEYAKSLGEVEGRAKFVEIVTAGIDRNTVALGDSLSNAEMAANDLANAMDGAMSTMGAGAGEAQAQVYGVLAGIVDICNQAPGLEYAAGYLGYFASGGATVVGSLLAIGSQIGMTILGFQAMGITSIASFTGMAASAMAAAPAIWAALGPVLLGVAAVALIAAAAIYALDKAFHYKEDRELAANIAKGDETSVKLLDMENKKRAKKGKKQLTMEEFQGNPDADLLKEDPGAGDMGGAGIDKMQAKLDALASGPPRASMPTMPSMPTPDAPTMPAMPSGLVAIAAKPNAPKSDEGDEPKPKRAKKPTKPRKSFVDEAVATGIVDERARSLATAPETKSAPIGTVDAALVAYLRNGGDVNDYSESRDTKKARDVSRETSGAPAGEPLRVKVPFPEVRQRALPNGKIEITLLSPPPIVIDNPLERKLKSF